MSKTSPANATRALEALNFLNVIVIDILLEKIKNMCCVFLISD